MVRFIRLKSNVGDNTSQFTCNLSAPIVLNPNAKIALKSVNLNGLDQTFLRITRDLIITFKPSATISYNITVPAGKYSKNSLVSTITNLMNSAFTYDNFNVGTATEGFEWRCSIGDDDRFVYTYKRIANNSSAEFSKSTNVGGAVGSYKRSDANSDDTAFIISKLPVNRGNTLTQLQIADGSITTKLLFGLTSTTAVGLTSLPISNYLYGTGVNPSDNNFLYTIVNGAFGEKIGTGFKMDTIIKIQLEHFGGIPVIKLVDGTGVVATQNIASSINLFNNYYTALTLETDPETFTFPIYYDSPFLQQVGQSIIENLAVIPNEISNLSAQATLVSVIMNDYTQSTLGFSTNPTPATKSDGAYKAEFTLDFSYLQDVVIQMPSLSQLEGYDTAVGYRVPILGILDNLTVNSNGEAFNEVQFPIYISLSNTDKMMISQFTVRITSEQQTFAIQNYSSISILIED
jgi:hypothetical protein